jgi:hypothetical protein
MILMTIIPSSATIQLSNANRHHYLDDQRNGKGRQHNEFNSKMQTSASYPYILIRTSKKTEKSITADTTMIELAVPSEYDYN